MTWIPKSSPQDPLIRGEWVVAGGWLWWKWTFLLGWEEWIPGWCMVEEFMEIGFNGHPPSMPAFHRAHWEYYATLHERLVGPAPACDFNELWELIHAHRGYLMNRPDNAWYYNTIPTYTGTASFVRNQDSFLAMFFVFCKGSHCFVNISHTFGFFKPTRTARFLWRLKRFVIFGKPQL